MIKKISISVLLGVVIVLCINTRARTSATGTGSGSTAAPGELTCAKSPCHTTYAVNSGTASVSITGISDYTPNTTYSLTVSITNYQNLKNGFEITAIKDADSTMAGTFTITDAVNTQIQTGTVLGGIRNYVKHNTTGSNLSAWTFDWTAPASDVGSITFYAGVNDGNNNGNRFGDYIYTTSLNVNVPVGIDSTADDWITVGANTTLLNNVAIGTTVPASGYKLSVDGKIIAEEIQVLPSGSWPDYVFNKEYKLLTLEEVAQFIEMNKHLPGVPKAETVEKDGISLGEMIRLLMEKVEELTLHMIEQSKQLKQQSEQIEALLEENNKLRSK